MSDDMRPSDVEGLRFRKTLIGYSPEEVQDALVLVAETLRSYESRSERAYEIVGQKLGDMLQSAQDHARELEAAAEEEASRITDEARGLAEEIVDRARSEVSALTETEARIRERLRVLRDELASLGSPSPQDTLSLEDDAATIELPDPEAKRTA